VAKCVTVPAGTPGSSTAMGWGRRMLPRYEDALTEEFLREEYVRKGQGALSISISHAGARRAGRVNLNVVPWPRHDSAQIRPPWRSMHERRGLGASKTASRRYLPVRLPSKTRT
jgi:hypothetical protein